MDHLIASITDKAELRGISPRYVGNRIKDYFHHNPGFLRKYDENKDKFVKTKEFKVMRKEIRAKLREVYGAFILGKYSKMHKALDAIQDNPSLENHKKLLAMHRSSKERLGMYEDIYKRIFDVTGKPERILDLACGLNPISYPMLGCRPEYLASDISPVMCQMLQDYFDFMKIKGTAFVFDILEFKQNEFNFFAESDICFLFKALDSVETMRRNFTEELLRIPTKNFVVSFARQSLGGRKEIGEERRTWFENMLKRHKLKNHFFKMSNESFYIVQKH